MNKYDPVYMKFKNKTKHFLGIHTCIFGKKSKKMINTKFIKVVNSGERMRAGTETQEVSKVFVMFYYLSWTVYIHGIGFIILLSCTYTMYYICMYYIIVCMISFKVKFLI